MSGPLLELRSTEPVHTTTKKGEEKEGGERGGREVGVGGLLILFIVYYTGPRVKIDYTYLTLDLDGLNVILVCCSVS